MGKNMIVPNLTEEQVVKYCGPNMYAQGASFLSKNLFDVFFQELSNLTALALNSNNNVNVSIYFDKNGIISSYCSCESNQYGPCKHIAALLIMWRNNANIFLNKSRWLEALHSRDKKELIALIQKLVNFSTKLIIN